MSSRLPPTRPAHCSRAEGEGAESGDRLGSTEIAGCTKAALRQAGEVGLHNRAPNMPLHIHWRVPDPD